MRVIGVPWHFEPVPDTGEWRKVYDKEQVCENIPKQMGAETISISVINGNAVHNDCDNSNALLEVR
jgi:hypothetical protein